MYVIKMNADKSLTATIKATIYQGEKNADTLKFLVPQTYEDDNFADCTMQMRYILPNGIGKSEELIMLPEPYKDYYQYQLPIETELTDFAGDIELWLNAVNHNKDFELITETIFVTVSPSKNIEDYLPEKDRNQLNKLSERINELEKEKADNIIFDEDERYLQLTSKGVGIGDKISANLIDDDTIIDFDNITPSPGDDKDDVIYF